jgi:hypothetical protein
MLALLKQLIVFLMGSMLIIAGIAGVLILDSVAGKAGACYAFVLGIVLLWITFGARLIP